MRPTRRKGELYRLVKRAAVMWLAAGSLAACTTQLNVIPNPAEINSTIGTQAIEATLPSPPAPLPTPDRTAIWATSVAITALTATAQPTALLTPTVVPTHWCGESWCLYDGHFVLQRPIQGEPYEQVDPTYRYANTEGGTREPHRGVEFQAPAGDRVRAAGDGTVDQVVREGEEPAEGLGTGYGNMVILEHHFPGISEAIYTVYGHLAGIDVEAGESVESGQVIGTVGATGAATGPHLHFEARVGSDRQADTQNPELWLVPSEHGLRGLGSAIAGRIQKADGSLVSIKNIAVQAIDDQTGLLTKPVYYLESYADTSFHPDTVWRENFAIGDLPRALYRVAFQYEGRQVMVSVPAEAGKLSVMVITVP